MRRAQAALPASRATASYGQVRAALETLQDIELRSRMRSRMRADGFDPSIDITYPDGQSAYAQQLMNEGKTLEEAADVIAQLFVRYGISPEVVGILRPKTFGFNSLFGSAMRNRSHGRAAVRQKTCMRSSANGRGWRRRLILKRGLSFTPRSLANLASPMLGCVLA